MILGVLFICDGSTPCCGSLKFNWGGGTTRVLDWASNCKENNVFTFTEAHLQMILSKRDRLDQHTFLFDMS